MLETLAHLGEFIGGIAVVATLAYLAYQLSQTRAQMHADATQKRRDARIDIWLTEWESDAFHSAQDKFFEYELYRRDALLHEIEELTLREVRAFRRWLTIELVYFQRVYDSRAKGLFTTEDSRPLDYMLCMNSAPARREWKDTLRLNGHFPGTYILHVDQVVKRYDIVEQRMTENDSADYHAVFQEVFEVPPPPSWLSSST